MSRHTLLALVALTACYRERVVYVSHPPPAPAAVGTHDDEDPVCIATFQPALAPYGGWIEDDAYGLIWIPHTHVVGVGFAPYISAGHWIYTSEGYIWASDHSWGWMTFHYGRWMYVGAYGWVWVPGARYAPSWVEWRYGGGYVGWAPMRPTWRWRTRVAYHLEAPPAPHVFVPSSAFFSRDLHLYVAPPAEHHVLLGSTNRWVAPPAQTFVGPPPAVAGIAKSYVLGATAPPPAHAKPHAVPWAKPPQVAAPGPVLGQPPPAYKPQHPPVYKPPPPVVHPPPVSKPPPVMTPPPIKPKPKPGVIKPLSIP